MKLLTLLAALCLITVSCAEKETVDFEAARESMIEADKAFSLMSVEEGMRPAFDYYMDDNATMYRDGMDPITGREDILSLYPPADNQAGILSWEPFFAEISESGDLGYTLGKYVYTVTDTLGIDSESYGYYVTIWKKQPDGSWKYVFDTGVNGPQPDEKVTDEIPEE